MGFSNVANASGAFFRAEAEKNLLNKENQNILRVGNSVANARGTELDARAKEASDSSRKYVDTFLQVKSAEAAKDAATFGFWASFANLATKVVSSASSGKGVLGTIVASIGDAFATLGAYFAMQGAADEVKLLSKQFGQLSEAAQQDKNMVAAMDGNPAV